ncbi:MAG: (deoxy)nucleoside triphosphate pyrophosphohydrolase [Bryobacteraceae bacterium]
MTTVVAGILRRGGRVLACRRAAHQPHPLKWEFPGGKVEPGETETAALARELEEELGIRAGIGPEVARYEFQYPGKARILLVFYEIERYEGEIRNLVFDEIRWEAPERLAAYDFLEGDVEFVRRLT